MILLDSLIGLLRAHHPSLGASVIFGHVIWSGWLMSIVLFLSAIAPFFLGRMKLQLAIKLHDKTLKADADMNRADWVTALAGIVGIFGVSLGFWWADGAMGVFISGGIVRDGLKNLREVVSDLMDSRPMTVEGQPSQVPERVRAALHALPWVINAEVRMREEGHVFAGELFLTITDCHDLSSKLAEAKIVAAGIDWRVHDMVIEFHDAEQTDGVAHPG
jgi:divalent metal cation (Fe/Co/Zn/Cd) transporter